MNAIDKSGQMAEGLPFAMKGAELLGKTKSPEEFRRYMESFVRAQQVMGKTMTPEQQFEFAKYARSAGPQLSDRYLSTTALSLGQEMGGSTAGNAVAMLQKQLVGGFQGDHAAAKEFVRLGLAREDQFEKTKTGEIKGMKSGEKIQGQDLAMTDPDKWFYDVVQPAMEKAGIKSQQDQAAEIMRLTHNRSASDLLTKFLTQRQALENHANLYNEAQGLDAAQTNQRDPYQAASAFSAAITNFAGVASGPAVAKASEGLSTLGKAISGFTPTVEAWTKAHPTEAAVAGGVGVAGAGYVGSRLLGGGIRRMLGRGGAAAAEGVGAEASVLGLGAAITTLGTAAAGATGLIAGLYSAMAATDPLGKEGRKKLDDEILTREGRQPGGPNENTINPFATGGWKPWVKDLFGGGAPVGTSGTGPELPGYAPYAGYDLREASKPPNWSVNQPQKSWPMTGAGGATAGAEGPEYPGITPGLGDLQSQLQQAGNGAGEAGAKAAGDFGQGFFGQLEETVSKAGELIEQLRGMLDFSASPKISPTGDAGASAPRRTSSLGAYDHGRASASGGAGWPLG